MGKALAVWHEVQNQENKSWKNEELRVLEQDLPKLQESDLVMIRWWATSRAPDVATWQCKYRIEWDATEK